MTYRVEWTKSARKDRNRLDAVLRARIDAAVAELATNPRPRDAVPLRGESGSWRIRVGDYRVIYSINDARLVVCILRVGARGGIY